MQYVAHERIDTQGFFLLLSLVALGGAIFLLIGALYWKQISLSSRGKQISLPIFGFIAEMFLVVQALESTGLTTQFGHLLLRVSGGTIFGAVMVGALSSALAEVGWASSSFCPGSCSLPCAPSPSVCALTAVCIASSCIIIRQYHTILFS